MQKRVFRFFSTHLQNAEKLWQTGKHSEAIQLLVEQNAQQFDARVAHQAADYLLAMHEYARAQDLYKQLPYEKQIVLKQAQCLFALKQPNDANAMLKALAEKEPEYENVVYEQLGLNKMQMATTLNDWNEVIEILSKANNTGKVHFARARAYMVIQNYEQAILELKMWKEQEQHSLASYLLGDAHMKLSQHAQADYAYSFTLNNLPSIVNKIKEDDMPINPELLYCELLVKLASLRIKMTDQDMAIVYMNRLLSVDDPAARKWHFYALFVRAQAFYFKKEYSNAVHDLEKSLGINPQFSEAKEWLSKVKNSMKQ